MFILNNNLKKGYGTLIYYKNWSTVNLSNDFGNYYYSLIPKYKQKQRQKYIPHITVVRKEIEIPKKNWGFWNNKKIEFLYDPNIQDGYIYYYLNVYSWMIGYVRMKLGLSYFRQPKDIYDPWVCYHITIGNKK